MALFLVANDLSCAELMATDRELAFPRSVLDLLGGKMGQTVFGFPKEVQKRILRDEKPVEGRPGDTLPPAFTAPSSGGGLSRQATTPLTMSST